ncbi:hypothetical protein [Aliivibrio fischeri]|uniref:hypothetical protein n=1 Tax=Aliivibrio fischeri TaxID=668 RepID=UPI00080DFD4D|nr:hypothetical protein [Aliivibrio fischeri]OCH02113.1 hypothetical protein A6E11_04750 [Aliivibrio fischeri]OCH32349.1 hypothetical protein A6E13_14860 [Aliivibrio fischeri]
MVEIGLLVILALFFWGAGHKCLGNRIIPHTLTIRDFFITVFCSISPIVLNSLVSAWFTPHGFFETLKNGFKSGEVFLYTSAYLSAFFVLYVKGSNKPHGFILALVLYSGIAGALIYTFTYSSQIMKLTSYASQSVLEIVELTIVLSVFVVWYWSTLPTNHIGNAGASESQRQQESLEEKYRQKKGETS